MLVIKHNQGLYKAQTVNKTAFAPSLETLVEKLDPGIPAGRAQIIAEFLEAVISKGHEQIHHGVIS